VILIWLVFGEIMVSFWLLYFCLMCLVRIGSVIRWLIGLLKKFWIWLVCRLIVISWFVLVVLNRLVINCVEIGLCL